MFLLFRVYPYLCQAVYNFAKDRGGLSKEKKCYVSLIDVPTRHKLRELTTSKVGTLVRISGQVVRTHPFHPELVLGTFLCLDCNSVIKRVEQQFKVKYSVKFSFIECFFFFLTKIVLLQFTNPTICSNPVCSNRKKFLLDTDESEFVDFQKIRIQEPQEELPRGSIPRSLEIIIRAENVETVQAGDRFVWFNCNYLIFFSKFYKLFIMLDTILLEL